MALKNSPLQIVIYLNLAGKIHASCKIFQGIAIALGDMLYKTDRVVAYQLYHPRMHKPKSLINIQPNLGLILLCCRHRGCLPVNLVQVIVLQVVPIVNLLLGVDTEKIVVFIILLDDIQAPLDELFPFFAIVYAVFVGNQRVHINAQIADKLLRAFYPFAYFRRRFFPQQCVQEPFLLGGGEMRQWEDVTSGQNGQVLENLLR